MLVTDAGRLTDSALAQGFGWYRYSSKWRPRTFDWVYEAVPAPGQRLYIVRRISIVAKCLAEFLHRGLHAVFVLDSCSIRPQQVDDLVVRNYLCRVFQQQS